MGFDSNASGRKIQHNGIIPDYLVRKKSGDEKEDLTLGTALDLVGTKIIEVRHR